MSAPERIRARLRRQHRQPDLLPGELAAVGDVFKDIAAQGYPLMRTRDRNLGLAGHEIIVNTPAEPMGIYTNKFMVADGSTQMYYVTYKKGTEKESKPLVLAAAYGEMEGTEGFTIVGGAHYPSWNWWNVDRRFRDPEQFGTLVSEPPGRFLFDGDHFTFRMGLSADRSTFTVTTGDSSTVTKETVPAETILDPAQRPEGIAVVRKTLFTALDQKYIPQK